MTKDEMLFKRALDILEWAHDVFGLDEAGIATKTALRGRLAHCDRCGKKLGGPDDIHTCSPQQPEQEPVCQKCLGFGWEPSMYSSRRPCAFCATTADQPREQPEQEPVAKVCHDLEGHIGWNPKLEQLPEEGTDLYTTPQQRKPLTDDDFLNWYDNAIWGNEDFKQGCGRAFEAGWQAAHGIKGEA